MFTSKTSAADRAVRAMRADQRREARRAERAMRSAARHRAIGKAGSLARRAAPGIGAALPVAAVNATAFVGQFAWVRQHVPWAAPLQVLFAVTVELVAIYLAWHAHKALLANDTAGRLKVSAYLFAFVIGLMNYSHYAIHWRPNALAVALGLMSTLSPWLWGIHSRRASRDMLMERGLIEEHAVRLGGNRWMWHPVKSVQVMYHSTWLGVSDPQRAIALYEEARQGKRASTAPRQEAGALPERAVPALEQAAPLAQQPLNGSGAVNQLAPVPAPVSPQGAPVVLAIAPMEAEPKMSASHPFTPGRESEVELALAGMPADQLPSERDVSRMLCPEHPEHNHRRPAQRLIAARKDADRTPDAAPPARLPRLGASDIIATPAGTLPGGING